MNGTSPFRMVALLIRSPRGRYHKLRLGPDIVFLLMKRAKALQDVSRDVLTRALRFVLPKFGQIPGSDSLTSLLCLEIISTKLNLNLNFDELWKFEINSSKVIRFLADCIEADSDRKIRKETLTRVEDVIVSAICRTGREETANGKIRLQ